MLLRQLIMFNLSGRDWDLNSKSFYHESWDTFDESHLMYRLICLSSLYVFVKLKYQINRYSFLIQLIG